MTKLPKHIADMVGIIDDEAEKPVVTHNAEPVVSIAYDPDGTITFAYDGTVIGWINEIRDPVVYDAKYRALAANGLIGYFWSIDTARSFLFSEAF